MILSFRTDRPGQTVQTKIRLLVEEQSDQSLHCLPSRSSLIWVCTVCHSVCIVWTHYSMVKPHISNFRVITTNVLGVRIFRKFTVIRVVFEIARIKRRDQVISAPNQTITVDRCQEFVTSKSRSGVT